MILKTENACKYKHKIFMYALKTVKYDIIKYVKNSFIH